MRRRILVLNGHPDPSPERFCGALVDAYENGARSAGHNVRLLKVGSLSFSLLRSAEAFGEAPQSPDILSARDDLLWAEHLVFAFPLWLGGPPALLKGFMECVACKAFLLGAGKELMPEGKLRGRSGRILVTMGMPSLIYRTIFLGHGTKAFERGILNLAGVRPVRTSYVGNVAASFRNRQRWIARARKLGIAAL